MIAPCRLYLTVDGEVVFGDDERAAFLLFSVPSPAEPEKVEAVATVKPVVRSKKKPES